ncbi:unnamed protein product [Arctogadus glacialis]
MSTHGLWARENPANVKPSALQSRRLHQTSSQHTSSILLHTNPDPGFRTDSPNMFLQYFVNDLLNCLPPTLGSGRLGRTWETGEPPLDGIESAISSSPVKFAVTWRLIA